MSIVFSDPSGGQGIVEQTRRMMRVDATQWPTANIVSSVNNYLDTVTGYLIGADRTFQWDDTNHTKLPEGTTTLTANQSDYSFLTDEQGNTILTLTGVSRLISGNSYFPLDLMDMNDAMYNEMTFGVATGTPTGYDKIADNIIRLNYLSSTTVAAGLKFHFQRTGSYFVAGDSTKSPGVSPLLHRGFVIAAALDGAITLGLENVGLLSTEMQKEEMKMKRYFADRDQDGDKTMRMQPIQFR